MPLPPCDHDECGPTACQKTPTAPKIIQIAINPDGETCLPCLYALRDDGSIWGTPLIVPKDEEHRLGKWNQLPPIP